MESELCRNCHSFFGHSEGLCSKCFKEAEVKAERPKPKEVQPVPKSEPKKEPELAAAPKPSRCQLCSRRLGPMGFQCRCSGFYCSRHRLPEEHSCTFDHKIVAKEKLRTDNPQVKADKFERI